MTTMTRKERKQVDNYIKATRKATKALKEYNKEDQATIDMADDIGWTILKRLEFDGLALPPTEDFLEEFLKVKLAIRVNPNDDFTLVTIKELAEFYKEVKSLQQKMGSKN